MTPTELSQPSTGDDGPDNPPRYGMQDWLETPIKESDYPPGGTGLPDGKGGTITMRELAKRIEEQERSIRRPDNGGEPSRGAP